MSDAVSRPFYDEYAWAYDLVIMPPDDGRLDFIAEAFARRGAGFGGFEFYGGYDAWTPAGATDRLVCVASRG
ncbi:MAG: hypothetical protein LC795_21080 [Acidobacteria bacterium]|nr:hypothetical protein [Acidobacteriota bacterium]